MTMTDEPDSVDELISRYLDGEATEAEITRVEADPALLARAESMRAAIDAVAAPVDIPTAELDRIRAAALATNTTTEQVTDLAAAAAAKRQSAERRNRFMAVAAAFVLLAVGVVAIRALPGGDDDDDSADIATADASDTDSGSDSADESGEDAGDLSVESTAAADEMAEEDDMAEEEGDDDMAEDTAESDMSFDDADDATEEAPAEGDDGERVDEDAPADPLPFAAIDLLPNELPPVADSAELLDIITAEYAAPIDAEENVGEPVDELLDRRCPAVFELLDESLPDGVASVEPVLTELAGVPVTVYIATGFDGSLVVVSHPTDDCETVTLDAIIPPS